MFALIFASSVSFGVSLNPEDVVRAYLLNSNSGKLITNESNASDTIRVRSKEPLDWRLDAKVGLLDNRLESTQSFTPSRTRSSSSLVGAQKSFMTGTTFRGELTNLARQVDSTFPVKNGNETTLSVSLRQPLLRNSFGRNTKNQIAQADLMANAKALQLSEQRSQLAYSTAKQYFRALKLQLQVKSLESSMERQEKLKSWTKLKLERGTSDLSDYLQIESSVLLLKERVEDARRNMQDIWQEIAADINLDASTRRLDPMTIELTKGSILRKGNDLCNSASLQDSAKLQSAQHLFESSNMSLSSAQDHSRPDVFVEAKVSNNAVNPDISENLGELQKHPFWSVNLGIEWTLGGGNADLLDASRQRTARALELSEINSKLKNDVDATCRESFSAVKKASSLASILAKLRERERREEERFQIGKIETTVLILAGNDRAEVELQLATLEADRFELEWKLRYLTGTLQKYLENGDS